MLVYANLLVGIHADCSALESMLVIPSATSAQLPHYGEYRVFFELIVWAIGFAAQYYTEKEESDEEMWGDRAILQRRYPPEDDLEEYFEARQEARQIKKFFRFDHSPI